MIYLDNAATTKPLPEVVDAMNQYLCDSYGNPGATYSFGLKCANAVFEARKSVANFMGCNPNQILFTSSGTEANNFAILGIKEYLKSIGRTRILVSEIEHDSVINAAQALTKYGFTVDYIPVYHFGSIKIDTLEQMLDDTVGLVSVMSMNNEIGSRNPRSVISELCHQNGTLFHTDCVQSAASFPVNISNDFNDCDFASISSHKIHGPKGVGALYVKDPTILNPIIYGGHNQEFGLRGGTENVPGIVGFGIACKNVHWCDSKLRELFMKHLRELTPGQKYKINSHTPRSHILSLTIQGIDAESLVTNASRNGLMISTGSACRSKISDESRTLKAIGLNSEEIKSTVRISFSSLNTKEEVIAGAEIIASYILSQK